MSEAVSMKNYKPADCPVCQETDKRQKWFLQQVLDPGEAGAIVAALGGVLKQIELQLKDCGEEQAKILRGQQQSGGSALGKMLMAFDPSPRKALLDALQKNGVRVVVEVNCQHTPEEKQTVLDHIKFEKESNAAAAVKPPGETI